MQDQFESGQINLDDAMGYWLHRAYQALRNETFRAFRDAGEDFSPEQWIVLVRLWERDGRPIGELASSTYRDAPTMSRIVDVMERRRLVERRQSEGDKRSRLVFLTRRGRALEPRLVPLTQAIGTRSMRDIPAEDLETTRTTLRRIFENLDAR